MGAIKAALGDGVITFLWMICISTVGPLTSIIAVNLGIKSFPLILGVTILLITLLILIFSPISAALGRASFNPVNTAAFYAAGISGDDLFSMALRFPAQALGAAGGVMVIREVMPSKYKSMLMGPSLKVDLHTGAIAEGVLTFMLTFALLWIIVKGPKNSIIKTLMIATTTVSMVVTGRTYTGPSLNPINAYGWAYINNRHHTIEHFYVYWIPAFTGAILAASIFRLIFLQPSNKVKNKEA